MNIKKILLSSVLVLIMTLFLYFIFYRSLWFLNAISIILIFVYSLIFVFVFSLFYKGIPGDGIKKGIIYGLAIWMIRDSAKYLSGIIVGYGIEEIRTINVFVLISSLILSILNGLIIGFIYKKEI